MPSLLGTSVAANYGRMTAQQTYGNGTIYSNFGTRQLRFIKVVNSGGTNDFTKGADGATGSYQDSNSLFSKAVRAAQTVAEIYFIGTPSSTAFVLAITDDTDNDSDVGSHTSGGSYGIMNAAIQAAMNSGSTITTTTLTATGASIA
jgi:hypothetical protein